MSKYSRIKPKITDLSPSEAGMVFNFLDELYYTYSLDVHYFQQEINKYSIPQQYFITKYSKEYFSLQTNSYLQVTMDNSGKAVDLDNKDEVDKFELYETTIKSNAVTLIKKIDFLQIRINERFKYYIKNKLNYSKDYEVEEPKGSKIPVYYKTKEFKLLFLNELKDLYSEEDILLFYNNSFTTKTTSFPPNLLSLEISNSGALYSALFNIYKNRYRDLSEKLKSVVRRYNGVIKAKKNSELYSELKAQKITKYHFMCIMYNAFPKIRDSFTKALQKDSELTLKQYLLTKSRNIK